jgi:uncharacterized protein YejL (UPF0352 family)
MNNPYDREFSSSDYEIGFMEDELDFEFDEELDYESDYSDDSVEALAQELLELSTDEELDYFFSKLIKGASKFVRSKTGKALLGTLKGVAKAALPTVGGVVGNLVAPGIGGAIGGQLASAVAKNLEMEFDDELDYETAKTVVRLAQASAQKLPQLERRMPPQKAAVMAVKQAARPMMSSGSKSAGKKGVWYRRGDDLIVVGL